MSDSGWKAAPLPSRSTQEPGRGPPLIPSGWERGPPRALTPVQNSAAASHAKFHLGTLKYPGKGPRMELPTRKGLSVGDSKSPCCPLQKGMERLWTVTLGSPLK